MKHKLLILFLAIAASTGIIMAEPNYSGSCGEHLTYSFNPADSTLTIEGYGEMAEPLYFGAWGSVYPWQYLGYKGWYNDQYVEEVYNEGFESLIAHVILPEGLTNIEGFRGCKNLVSVNIPSTITSLTSGAFDDCTALMLTVPSTVVEIGEYEFWNIPNVTYNGTATGSPWGAKSVNGVVDGYLVYSDESKTSLLACSSKATGAITTSNTTTSIGNNAFVGCENLTSISVPNTVTTIGERAFHECSNLTTISDLNNVTSIGDEAFYHCSSLTTISSLSSVKSIGSWAFIGCYNLTSLTISDKVSSIGSEAFYGVPNIIYNGSLEGSPWGAKSVNGFVDGYLVYNNNTKTQLRACLHNAEGTITLPDGLLEITAEAFDGCDKITAIDIPNSVTEIGDYAFSGCESLTTFTFPENTTAIGDGIVEHCYNLTTVVIPQNVTSIGERAFYDCPKLMEIIIPKKVTTIGEEAFGDCIGLQSISCKAVEPPTIYENDEWGYGGTFRGVEKYIPLNVPKESVLKYQSAVGWREFYHINGVDFNVATAIEEISVGETTSRASKVLRNGTLLILLPDGRTYNLQGAEVK